MERAIIFGQIGPGEKLRKAPLALRLRSSTI
jgi:DNA-binding GntR family transcriptional regulator